jgi:poly-gamma-glutamate synthesis protein (capsule biosynthesis protein)
VALIKLFLTGDVMTGRGIDQILPYPSVPFIPESYLDDAREYVTLAERVNGEIPRAVTFDYIWGEGLAILEQFAPEVRLINLETSVTQSDRYWPFKGINYRMHPRNVPCLTAAGIDCCALANNHVLDWGYEGLAETLASLQEAGILPVGAGENATAASAPAILPISDKGRVLVFSLGHESSGIPPEWAATPTKPGVNFLPHLSEQTVQRLGDQVRAVKHPHDLALASIHWGSNWGYDIPAAHREFAHHLIDQAGIDLVHGHSSHHVRALEVYHGKLILYGCGDLINDYEGISGYEAFRDDLGLMVFPTLETETGKLASLAMEPTQIRQFQLQRAPLADCEWLGATLNRISQPFGTHLILEGRTLVLR